MGDYKGRVETALEAVLLIAFFTAILYLGPGAASGHKIVHTSPTGYGASDAFQHEARVESIKQMGQYKNEASYLVVGLKDLPGFYPPLLYHIPVLLSDLSGIPSYDALFLIMGLVLALGAMAVYFLTSNISKQAAILAMPMAIFIVIGKPFLGIMTFGQMALAMSSMFLVALAWSISKSSEKLSWALIALFFAATINTHTSETVFFGFLLGTLAMVVIISKLIFGTGIKGKISGIWEAIRENKNLIIGVFAGFAISFYFLDIFIGAWMKAQAHLTKSESISPSFPAASVFVEKDFGFMVAAIFIGIVLMAILLFQKRRELGRIFQNPAIFSIIFSFWMLLVGLSTYIGFGLRAFQARMFWPITLAPLAGFGIYQLLKIISGLIPTAKEKLPYISIALAIILCIAAVKIYYTEPSPGSMDSYRYEPMKWVAENTPQDTRVFAFYSFVYAQTSALYNTQRVTYFMELDTLAKLMNGMTANGTINRTVQVTIASDSGIGFPNRKGILNYGQRIYDTPTGGLIDICNASYYIIDRAFPTNAQQIAQANMYLLQRFLNGNMTVVFDNNAVTVLKNDKQNGDCFA
jgi:hypothetical protein